MGLQGIGADWLGCDIRPIMGRMDLTYADLWERIAADVPGRTAQAYGGLTYNWAKFNRRANGVARALLDGGVGHQDKVAQYLYNSPAYMESVFAAFKVSAVPVNTNYRYTGPELRYLWDNADATAIVFGAEFTDTIETIRADLDKVKLWLWVDDGSGAEMPEWAQSYHDAAAAGTDDNVVGETPRAGSDLWFLYTGGTTGSPKGVMWEQGVLVALGGRAVPVDPTDDFDGWADWVRTNPAPPVGLPAAPLMHGTGQVTALNQLSAGGTVVTLPQRKLDAEAIWDAVERRRVTSLVIVGDPFSRPLLAALAQYPGRWDLSSLQTMVSSGAMWTQSVKDDLVAAIPQLVIRDALGSSEALGMGDSFTNDPESDGTAKFKLGAFATVLDDDNQPVEPGSGQIGRVAVRAVTPVGYYKDPEKSAKTFPVIDGVRHTIPGDYATVEADGTINLLGRGSVCINTGGEKVFPEEVEEALKTHSAVVDAVAVGVADERFGQVVNAVIEVHPGTSADTSELIGHVKTQLAAYKAPRAIWVVESLERAANGKMDYKRWTAHAAASAASTETGANA